MNYNQIAILFLQGTLVAFVILLLFHLRKQLGIGILFACLGLFQFMQVFLSSTVYVSITNGFLVSPGSSVLFTATLFALLIIYIKEDASETRKIIYALLIVNIVMTILIQLISWNLEESSTYNPFNVSTNLFSNNAWVLFVGTIALFLDSLLIIIIYEFISRHIRYMFLQICLTMLIVVSFDTIFFSIIAFWNFNNLNVIVISGLISKGVFVIFYSIIFYFYLQYFDLRNNESSVFKIKDVFQLLTYRQKFESARHDIKKASEEIEIKDIHYKTLTDISPVGIFQARNDGYTTFVNNRWCDISGVTHNDALGYGWLKAVHPEDRQIIKHEWELALTQKRRSEVNYRFVLSNGSVKWVLGQSVPEYNSQSQIIGFVGTITDITELKLIQQEQIVLKKKADESSRLKSAFLANMSHEIRTPMNGILGFAELLKNPNLTGEQQQKYIQIIEKGGARMLNIINDIVSISKIESGQMEVNMQLSNINEQIEYIYTFFKPDIEGKGMQFSFRNSLPSDEAMINTDCEKVYAILTNLVKNAIKYSEKGSIELGYNLKKDNELTELEFYVKDTGIGIPLGRQEAIFERFIQADIEDKMARQGAGLGLTISKAYVEMLGGKIWVEAEEENLSDKQSKTGGSTFYFTLPYETKLTIEYSHKNEITPAVTVIPQNNLKILIVEDDETSEEFISIIVQKFANKILKARTGTKAVETCLNNPDIDVVLMDIQLPQMNGYEATRKIREFNKEVVIIAQTAFAMKGDSEKAIAAGCNDYITKPIKIEELEKLIIKYLNEE